LYIGGVIKEVGEWGRVVGEKVGDDILLLISTG